MSKLSDLIAKSKEKSNGIAQPVLQSETKQEEKTISPQTYGTEGNVSEQTVERGTGIPQTGTANSVVEQGPPPGLKGLDLIRWKKNNANSQAKTNGIASKQEIGIGSNSQENRTKSNTTSSPQGTNTTPNNGVSATAIGGGEVKETAKISASQTADAQKINDGLANLEELRNHLTFLANNIEQPEVVAQVVRTIGLQLQNAPELVPQMSHAEVDLVVRGFRRAYTVAARKKSETKEAKQAKSKDTSELAALFADAGLKNLLK